MKIALFLLTLCFCINAEAQYKNKNSIYGNTISVLYDKLLENGVLSKTDTLYIILNEGVDIDNKQDKIDRIISFETPFLRNGESLPIYIINPCVIKKNSAIIIINICQIKRKKNELRIISSGTFVFYYEIICGFYKLIKIENRGI